MKKVLLPFVVIALCLLTVSSCCEKRAKYVFYFIGDGMGFSHVALAEAYLATEKGVIGSEPLNFSKFPELGIATTYSASNYITCSSAAGTALSTGHKTNNGMLGVLPDSTNLTSISYKIHDAGYKVGIMTTVTIDHATPGAFYAHSPSRSDYYSIGKELSATGFEFFGGGGFATPRGKGQAEQSLYEITENAGYTVAYGLDEFNAKKENASKIVLFQEKGKEDNILPYALGRKKDDLTLSQVVSSAIEVLENEKGFFIMAEGGKIDWAAHSNDLANTIFETIDMADAVEIAYQFYLKHKDETLIIVTADHETGGVSLGMTKGYVYNLKVVDSIKVNATETTVENYMNSAAVMDTVSQKAQIGWTTKSHTGGGVPVYAIGAGSELFRGRMDNTDIPQKICKAMGIEY